MFAMVVAQDHRMHRDCNKVVEPVAVAHTFQRIELTLTLLSTIRKTLLWQSLATKSLRV